MSNIINQVPGVSNEPVLDYLPGSEEREAVITQIATLKHEYQEIPMVIDGKDVFGRQKVKMSAPHEIHHVLGHHAKGTMDHTRQAIDAALKAKADWERLLEAIDWTHFKWTIFSLY